MGLCIGRKVNESVRIGQAGPGAVVVTVVELQHGKCKLLIEAPREVPLVRTELDKREVSHDQQ